MSNADVYVKPEIPLSDIDKKNRTWLATGSPRLAAMGADADYNGHCVTVCFRPHAVSGPTWTADYFWAGRHVLGRGDMKTCLAAAEQEYKRGARGSAYVVELSEDSPEPIEEQVAMCEDAGLKKLPGRDMNPWNLRAR